MALTAETTFTRIQIVRIFQQYNDSENIQRAVELIKSGIKTNISEEEINKLRQVVSTLRSRYKIKWSEARRIQERFELNNADWLSGKFMVPISFLPPTPNQSQGPLGRSTLSYSEMSARSQRRSVAALLAEENEPEKLLHAGRMAAKASGKTDLAYVISQALRSPTKPSKIRKVLLQPQERVSHYSAEEGLALLLDCDLSKEQYLKIRAGSKAKNADIYPNYNKIRETKNSCRPLYDPQSSKDYSMEVSLQCLLNHTVTRIIKLAGEVLIQVMERHNQNVLETELICSWGMDGSSGQSMYKQVGEAGITDSNLFSILLIPLRLSNCKTTHPELYWVNRTPQSHRFCRPIKISYEKETPELVRLEYKFIMNQIQRLQEISVAVSAAQAVKVKFVLAMTLIDGKILSQLTDTTSMQCCPVCHAPPSSFNSLENMDSQIFSPEPNSLTFGISPLHAWIRFFECCLHIAYRQSFKKHQARGPELQRIVAQEKARIKIELQKEFGLIVDQPKPGGSGTTNDGNTARRAFAEFEKFARILGLNVELVKRFRIILVSISCDLPVNPVAFGDYCRETAFLYVSCYKWFVMPATVHKVLIHGAQILANSVLPVGVLSEQGGETKQKFYKRDREFHSRKISRKDTTLDTYNRAMDASDPVISTFSLESRLRKRKRLHIPIEVLNLVVVPDPMSSDDETSESDSEAENDTEDATGLTDFYNQLDMLNLTSDNEIGFNN